MECNSIRGTAAGRGRLSNSSATPPGRRPRPGPPVRRIEPRRPAGPGLRRAAPPRAVVPCAPLSLSVVRKVMHAWRADCGVVMHANPRNLCRTGGPSLPRRRAPHGGILHPRGGRLLGGRSEYRAALGRGFPPRAGRTGRSTRSRTAPQVDRPPREGHPPLACRMPDHFRFPQRARDGPTVGPLDRGGMGHPGQPSVPVRLAAATPVLPPKAAPAGPRARREGHRRRGGWGLAAPEKKRGGGRRP